jgi:hypothetical protein
MWLLSMSQTKLKHFIASGTRVELRRDDKSKLQEDDDLFETAVAAPDVPFQGPLSLDAFPDAEHHIPLAWKTVDRVLDILLWHPKSNGAKPKNKRIQVDSDVESVEQKIQTEFDAVFESGEQPSARNTETVVQWESRKKRPITTDDIGDVVWIFVKWDDLNYGEGQRLELRASYVILTIYSHLGFASSTRRRGISSLHQSVCAVRSSAWRSST